MDPPPSVENYSGGTLENISSVENNSGGRLEINSNVENNGSGTLENNSGGTLENEQIVLIRYLESYPVILAIFYFFLDICSHFQPFQPFIAVYSYLQPFTTV